MKLLANLANAALLAFVGYNVLRQGMPADGDEFTVVLGLMVAPILSLYCLNRTSHAPSWVALYLERRALEERSKIEALKRTEESRP